MTSIGGWCIIPPAIISRSDISNDQKLLWGRINGLINDQNYCDESNHYLGEQIGIHEKNISKLLANLAEKHLITIKYQGAEAEKKRVIYLNDAHGCSDEPNLAAACCPKPANRKV